MLSCKKLLLKTTILLFLFTCWLGLNANTLILTNDTISEAVHLFEAEDYTNAIPLFEKIVKEEPDNPLMNYYYGASLAETNIFNDETNNSLLKAVSGNTPDKVLYYVGLLFKNKELWSSAIKYFNLFKSVSSFDEIKKLDIDGHIAECKEHGGTALVQDLDSVPTENTIIDSSIKLQALIYEVILEQPDTIPMALKTIPEQIKTTKIRPLKAINFQINSDIAYSQLEHFKTSEGKKFYLQGTRLSNKIDSLLQQSDSLRIIYDKSTSMDERNLVAERIMSAEQTTIQLKPESENYIANARQLEASYWNYAPQSEVDSFRNVLNKISRMEEPQLIEDTKKTDSSLDFDASFLLLNQKIEPNAKKETKKDELIYRIQIGAYSRGLPAYMDRLYKKLSVIRKIENYTDDKGIVVYTTGRLTNFEDAIKMQNQVRLEGIKDAFVVPYLNGKRISIKEAKEFTK